MKETRPVVHVVDDDVSFRTAVLRLLRAAGHETRGYGSAAELLAAEPGQSPGCIVLDVRMPGASGLDLQKALAAAEEPLPIVFLTGHGDIPATVQAMKAGAVDFLTKPVERGVLLPAVEGALARDVRARTERTRLRELRARYDTLTPREAEVLPLVVSGLLNKQIAAGLGLAERTVKAHRARVMEKMRVESLADLVRMASQLGLQKPGDR
jgi:FixJ family two-component response regulator